MCMHCSAPSMTALETAAVTCHFSTVRVSACLPAGQQVVVQSSSVTQPEYRCRHALMVAVTVWLRSSAELVVVDLLKALRAGQVLGHRRQRRHALVVLNQLGVLWLPRGWPIRMVYVV